MSVNAELASASTALERPSGNASIPLNSGNQEPSLRRPRQPRTERKAACTRCRQQKVRCDAYLDSTKPCSRCRRLNSNCDIPKDSRQVHARRRRPGADVANEQRHRQVVLETERSHLRPPLYTARYPLMDGFEHIAPMTSADETSVLSYPHPFNRITENGLSPLSSITHHTMDGIDRCAPIISSGETPIHPPGSNIESGRIDHGSSIIEAESTATRTLETVVVDGQVIEECFMIFFSKYHQLLPILDSGMLPDAYYQQSSVLFWSIVGVGSRSLASNPTLLRSLGSQILDLALMSSRSREDPTAVIKGLLLLCTWPFPTHSAHRDITFALCGLLMNLALQAGLHLPSASHEFTQSPAARPTPIKMQEIAMLWLQIVITCQQNVSIGGYPPTLNFDSIRVIDSGAALWNNIPEALKSRYKAQQILMRADAEILALDRENEPAVKDLALKHLLSSLEAQLLDVEVEGAQDSDDVIANLYKLTARLQLRVFHFYSSSNYSERLKIGLLYETACSVINEINHLHETIGLASYCTHYIYAMLALAAFALLKLTRTIPDGEFPYGEKGKLSYFRAIALCKQTSVENNDLSGKTSEILSVLWLSDIYKNPNVSWPLRIRGRLSMSIVFDALWWWREHYKRSPPTALPNPRSGSQTDQPTAESLQTPINESSLQAQSLLFDEQWLYDIDWAVTLDPRVENVEIWTMQNWPPSSGCIA